MEWWKGSQTKQSYSYLIQKNVTNSFTWSFQRMGENSEVGCGHAASTRLKCLWERSCHPLSLSLRGENTAVTLRRSTPSTSPTWSEVWLRSVAAVPSVWPSTAPPASPARRDTTWSTGQERVRAARPTPSSGPISPSDWTPVSHVDRTQREIRWSSTKMGIIVQNYLFIYTLFSYNPILMDPQSWSFKCHFCTGISSWITGDICITMCVCVCVGLHCLPQWLHAGRADHRRRAAALWLFHPVQRHWIPEQLPLHQQRPAILPSL